MLTPNNPRKRLKWIVDTYAEKYPAAVAFTFDVAVHLFGMETTAEGNKALKDTMLAGSFLVEDPHDPMAIALLESAVKLFPDRHKADFILPWVARELVRWNKEEDAGVNTGRQRQEMMHEMKRLGPAIAQWARDEKIQLMHLSAGEVFAAVRQWSGPGRRVVPGTIVYQFADGWTVQELRTEEQLVYEGETMQHCVGDYCDIVARYDSFILSIRDTKGRPHVTIEYHVPSVRGQRGPNSTLQAEEERRRKLGTESLVTELNRRGILAILGTEVMKHSHVTQIFGKQNNRPAPKYMKYVWETINNLLEGDPMGLLISGWPDAIAFKGYTLNHAEISERATGHYKVAENVSFAGSKLLHVTFRSGMSDGLLLMQGTSFDRSLLANVTFDGCSMDDVSFRQAEILNVTIYNSDMNKVHFDGAMIEELRIKGVGVRKLWGMETAHLSDIATRLLVSDGILDESHLRQIPDLEGLYDDEPDDHEDDDDYDDYDDEPEDDAGDDEDDDED